MTAILNKKVLLSLGVIAFIAAAAMGATYAAWSATTNIDNNTVSTASVSLGQTGLIDKPISASDMLPGDFSEPGQAGIYNTSSVPLKLYMKTENLSDVSPTGICAATILTVYTGHAGTDPSTDGNGQIISGNNDEAERVVASKSVLDWMTQEELTGVPPFTTVAANSTQVTWQQAQLDPNADNSLQGQSCTWDEVFIGETV